MVAELAPVSPTKTFRYNDFPDSIPNDNLYASNYMIKRNNAHHYDSRYLNIVNHIGNGTGIGLDTNWNLMKSYSVQSINMQFMEYSPEADFLRLSVYGNSHPAYMNDPLQFTLTELFDNPAVGIPQHNRDRAVVVFPDPARESVSIAGVLNGRYLLEIISLSGKVVKTVYADFPGTMISVSALPAGFYTVRLTGDAYVCTGRFVKQY